MATYSGTPRTWSASEQLTASLMNQEVRDPLAALTGAWDTWTTRVDQGATTNISHTKNYAEYVRVGKLVLAQFKLTMSGSATSGAILIVLPVNASTTSLMVGTGFYDRSGSSKYPVQFVINAAGNVVMRRTDQLITDPSINLGYDPTFGLASGDIIYGNVWYEAA